MTRGCVSCCVLLVAAVAACSAIPAPPATGSRAAVLLHGSRRPQPLGLADPVRRRTYHQRRGGRARQDDALVDVHVDRAADGGNTTTDPYRLPTNIRPTYYAWTFTPHLSGDFTFDGLGDIYFNVLEDTKKIVLHSKELTYDKADCSVFELDEYGNADIVASVVDITYNTKYETATFTLSTTLKAGKRLILDFQSFKGRLNDDLDGFYRSSYTTASGQQRWLATTQFEPTGARRAFPCFDEPSFKARYDITIVHDKNMTAISNMPSVQTKIRDDGTIQETFMSTLPMSSYLVAFIVSDFTKLYDAENKFSTWARDDIIAGGQLSQQVGPQALKLLGEFNGIEYNLPKMDNAAIPDFSAGAMENWGLVTYREEDLITGMDSTVQDFESVATVICHEFGHQWTGDLVTLDWWSHTWLNEGFATFFESMTCADIKPDWNLEDKMLPNYYHIAMESDVRETQVPMSSPASTYDEIEEKFGVISYDKGGSVLRMFYHALTPEVFKKGMKRYLSVNMFKNTNPEHLFHALGVEAERSGLDLLPSGYEFAELARTWTEQAGVPVLTVERDYEYKLATFNQRRFFYKRVNDQHLNEQAWWIPVTVVSQASPDWTTTRPQFWFSPDQEDLQVSTDADKSQWILVNPKQTGYYRVNYDEQNWNMLSAAMIAKPTVFPAATRAQLINDALALARGGKLDYYVALPFLKAFKAEREVAPWQAALTAVKYLIARVANTDAFDPLLRLLSSITADAYKEVGFAVQDSDSHETRYLRMFMASYACYAGNGICLDDASTVLQAWLADPAKNSLHPDIRSSALCYGIRGSGQETFDALYKVWLAEKDTETRYNYLSALACASASRVQGLLSDAVNKKVSYFDGVYVFNAVYARVDNHKVLLDFVEQNAAAILSTFQNDFDVQLLNALIQDIRSRDELKEVKSWVNSHYSQDASGYETLQKAFQEAEKELESWYDKYYRSVNTWLVANAPSTRPTQAPTIAPTRRPTQAPTQAPTQRPTDRPTERPTERPTQRPTQSPTQGPTKGPTKGPTQGPTSGTLTPTSSTPAAAGASALGVSATLLAAWFVVASLFWVR